MQKDIYMVSWVVLFCILMALLGIFKCFVKQKTMRSKVIEAVLTICSCITGFLVLYGMLPSVASPQVNGITFYSYGLPSDFRFICEFSARNEGKVSCEIQKVEFNISDTEFTFKKVADLIVGRFESSSTRVITNTILPQSVPSTNQRFSFLGNGTSATAGGGDFDDAYVEVKISFNSKGKTYIIKKTVPVITSRQIQNMR